MNSANPSSSDDEDEDEVIGFVRTLVRCCREGVFASAVVNVHRETSMASLYLRKSIPFYQEAKKYCKGSIR